MSSLIIPDTDQQFGGVSPSTDPASLDRSALPSRRPHTTVVLTRPVGIEPTGVSTVDDAPVTQPTFQERALEQWRGLQRAYRSIDAVELLTLDPTQVYQSLAVGGTGDSLTPPEALSDAVFCANVAVPYPDERRVVLSRMAASSRADEPEYAAAWLKANGYEVERLPAGVGPFEGTGDAVWHPGRALLWGGVGERTDREVYDHLAERMGVPVITLDPTDRIDEDVFFHLDICFAPLDSETVLLIEDVFSDDDLATIESVFDQVIEVPYSEGRPTGQYAANAHCPDGEHVVLQAGATKTISRLEAAGYTPVPVETGAFIDGCAGSVFCMKLALP